MVTNVTQPGRAAELDGGRPGRPRVTTKVSIVAPGRRFRRRPSRATLVGALLGALALFATFGLRAQSPPDGVTPAEISELVEQTRRFLAAERKLRRTFGAAARRRAKAERFAAHGACLDRWRELDGPDHRLLRRPALLRAIVARAGRLDATRRDPSRSDRASGRFVRRDARSVTGDRTARYWLRTPVTPSPGDTGLVVLLPGRDAGTETWTSVSDHFARTWANTTTGEQFAFVAPELGAGDTFDLPAPRSPDDPHEPARWRLILDPLDDALTRTGADRARVYLDCGQATGGFGLRLAAAHPDRFAGVLVRGAPPPRALPDPLDGLRGVGVLAIGAAPDRDPLDALVAGLRASAPGPCHDVRIVPGDPPFPAAHAAVSKWTAACRAARAPTTFALVPPLAATATRAWWVELVAVTEAPSGFAGARLVATADRPASRIVLTSERVTHCDLWLTDDLVDLDRPFTLELATPGGPSVVRTLDAGRDAAILLASLVRFDADPRRLAVARRRVDPTP